MLLNGIAPVWIGGKLFSLDMSDEGSRSAITDLLIDDEREQEAQALQASLPFVNPFASWTTKDAMHIYGSYLLLPVGGPYPVLITLENEVGPRSRVEVITHHYQGGAWNFNSSARTRYRQTRLDVTPDSPFSVEDWCRVFDKWEAILRCIRGDLLAYVFNPPPSSMKNPLPEWFIERREDSTLSEFGEIEHIIMDVVHNCVNHAISEIEEVA